MKKISVLTGSSILLFMMLFSTSTNLTSCIKETTIRDTVIVKDTIRETIPCDCVDLKKGLVAYYNFNNGTLNDSSGKNNHITFSNATKTTDRFGKPNGAYLFNGTSQFMQVPNSTSLNPTTEITMMAIVKVNGWYTGVCKGNQIFGKGGEYSDYINGIYWMRFKPETTSDCMLIGEMDNQKPYGSFGDNNGNYAAGAISDTVFVKKDSWVNYTYTYANGVSRFYINGVLKQTTPWGTNFTPNNQPLYIGQTGSSQYPYWFNGAIDEIRIYEKALCETEVKKLSELKN